MNKPVSITIKGICTGVSSLGAGPCLILKNGKLLGLYKLNRTLFYKLRKLDCKDYTFKEYK